MSDTLKNRLIGTIILVALVVIFLPQWLDGEKQTSKQSFLEVPEPPESIEINTIDEVDVAALKEAAITPEIIEDLRADDAEVEQSVDLSSTTETSQLEQQTLSLQDEPISEPVKKIIVATPGPEQDIVKVPKRRGGWVIQLGVFGNQANINRVVNQVSSAGYQVFQQSAFTANGRLTRILVGPDLDKQKLEEQIPELKKITGLTGKITEYQVSAR